MGKGIGERDRREDRERERGGGGGRQRQKKREREFMRYVEMSDKSKICEGQPRMLLSLLALYALTFLQFVVKVTCEQWRELFDLIEFTAPGHVDMEFMFSYLAITSACSTPIAR